MSDLSACAVILVSPKQRDPLALAKALAAVRKTPLQDQIGPAKKAWGIVAENLGGAEAESLSRSLRESGVETAVIPNSSLIQVSDAEPLARMEAHVVKHLVLVAAAGFTATSTTTKTVKEGPSAGQKILSTGILLATGLPIKIGGRERSVEKTQSHSDVVFYLDLLYKDPARRLRVDAQRFDYSFLKERKLYQVLGNFKLLVEDLVKAAPGAWRNHGTQALLEGKPAQAMGYESLADLERESRWLLTLQRSLFNSAQ